jgi:VanZ family protein
MLVLAWLPALLWMAVIFGASTDLLSGARTSRFIGPVLRWFQPDLSDQAIRRVQLVVRKGAHVAEYAIFSILLYRALRRSRREEVEITRDGWCRACAFGAVLIATLYAASDEWHQSLVPSRDGTVHDVIIDSAGAALGLLLWHRWLGLRREDRSERVRA